MKVIIAARARRKGFRKLHSWAFVWAQVGAAEYSMSLLVTGRHGETPLNQLTTFIALIL
ncbi:hypothetical protein FIBSPDRAFT_847685, partial [Athelia psychrophila]